MKASEIKPATDLEFQSHSTEINQIQAVFLGMASFREFIKKDLEKIRASQSLTSVSKPFLDFKSCQAFDTSFRSWARRSASARRAASALESTQLGFEIQKCRISRDSTDFCKFSWLAYRLVNVVNVCGFPSLEDFAKICRIVTASHTVRLLNDKFLSLVLHDLEAAKMLGLTLRDLGKGDGDEEIEQPIKRNPTKSPFDCGKRA